MIESADETNGINISLRQGDPMTMTLPNFRLLSDSPCIDAGDSSVVGIPDTDFDGDPRILCGAVDMGADESVDFAGVNFLHGDVDTDGTFNGLVDAAR